MSAAEIAEAPLEGAVHRLSGGELSVEVVGGRDAVARRDYDSTHLTVSSGERLEAIEQVGDYLLCRNAAGVEGWVPESCVEETVEEA